MTKLAPEWVRTSDPVIRSPARYRWTTAPATTHCTTLPHSTPPYYAVHHTNSQYSALQHSTLPYHTVHHPNIHYTSPNTQYTTITQGYIALPHCTMPYHTVHIPITQYITLTHNTPLYRIVYHHSMQYTAPSTALPHSTPPYHTVHTCPTVQYTAHTVHHPHTTLKHSTPPYYTVHCPTAQYTALLHSAPP